MVSTRLAVEKMCALLNFEGHKVQTQIPKPSSGDFIAATTTKMRLLVISTLAALAMLAAVCAAEDENDNSGEGFSLQFDGWPSGEKLGLRDS